MIHAPRVPDISAVEVGSLLASPSGDLYVVVRKEENRAYFTAELEDVEDFVQNGGEPYTEVFAPEGWNAEDYPQAPAGIASDEIVTALRSVNEHADAVRSVMANVVPADHRRLYNALHSINACGARIARGPEDGASQYRDLRKREVEKARSIVGSLSAVATLLGTDEDTLRRVAGV